MSDMTYRGVQDPNYVRPPGTEFPKIVYRKSADDPRGYRTRLVKTQEEQDALAPGWLTDAKAIHHLLDPIHAAQYGDKDDATPAAAPAEAPKTKKRVRKPKAEAPAETAVEKPKASKPRARKPQKSE